MEHFRGVKFLIRDIRASAHCGAQIVRLLRATLQVGNVSGHDKK